jgi:exopolyphosphatase/guanosine-5'-triphosphate,3'-diphosphate pyrophosphatase
MDHQPLIMWDRDQHTAERAVRSSAAGDAASDPKVREAAVIDVGSNSVRLVVYRLIGRAMTPILNEKVMAGLGRRAGEGKRLSPDGVEQAMRALTRFRALLDGLGVSEVHAVATAAVREAVDGAAFIARVRTETGIDLRRIDGGEEARLAALGLLAGAPDAHGVVGDLGGSSLELAPVHPAGPGIGETFALGPFALMQGEFDGARVAAIADAAFAASDVLKAAAGAVKTFYAVGGAWRALGRIDIALRQHPLAVLHHHEMSRAEVLKVTDFIRRQSRKSLERFEEAAAKRAETLPYAAVVLERLIRAGQFETVVLSAYGLREGLLMGGLRAGELAVHPLVAAAEAFGSLTRRARLFGAALDALISPVFEAAPPAFSSDRCRVLRAAACRLADLGATLHPDQRSGIMFDLVLRAPFPAISHAERAYLAASVHHRYTRQLPRAPAYDILLTEDLRRHALALGAAMRLGADISGRSADLVRHFSLSVRENDLVLRVANAHAALITEQAGKRLEPLAQAMGLKAVVETG